MTDVNYHTENANVWNKNVTFFNQEGNTLKYINILVLYGY
jgi:hypothetical protein